MDRSAGTKALDALDRALAQQPERDGDAFSEATENLCRLRDTIIADCRGGDSEHRERLGMLNAIISTALAGHFPLGRTPWPEVQTATNHLRTLVGEL